MASSPVAGPGVPSPDAAATRRARRGARATLLSGSGSRRRGHIAAPETNDAALAAAPSVRGDNARARGRCQRRRAEQIVISVARAPVCRHEVEDYVGRRTETAHPVADRTLEVWGKGRSSTETIPRRLARESTDSVVYGSLNTTSRATDHRSRTSSCTATFRKVSDTGGIPPGREGSGRFEHRPRATREAMISWTDERVDLLKALGRGGSAPVRSPENSAA